MDGCDLFFFVDTKCWAITLDFYPMILKCIKSSHLAANPAFLIFTVIFIVLNSSPLPRWHLLLILLSTQFLGLKDMIDYLFHFISSIWLSVTLMPLVILIAWIWTSVVLVFCNCSSLCYSTSLFLVDKRIEFSECDGLSLKNLDVSASCTSSSNSPSQILFNILVSWIFCFCLITWVNSKILRLWRKSTAINSEMVIQRPI